MLVNWFGIHSGASEIAPSGNTPIKENADEKDEKIFLSKIYHFLSSFLYCR